MRKCSRLLRLLQVGRHFRLVLLFQQRFVIGLRLIVVARDVGKLLFHHRRHIQPRLILIDLALLVFDFRFAVRDFQAIRLELTFQLQHRRAFRIQRRSGGRLRTGIIRSAVHVGDDPFPHLLNPRNLFPGLADVGMFIGVVRSQIRQLRLQLIQFFVDLRQPRRPAGLARLRTLTHSAILIDQRFQIGVLLLGPVQRVLVRLHLILKAGQDLQIALGLGGQLAQVLIFEHAQLSLPVPRVLRAPDRADLRGTWSCSRNAPAAAPDSP